MNIGKDGGGKEMGMKEGILRGGRMGGKWREEEKRMGRKSIKEKKDWREGKIDWERKRKERRGRRKKGKEERKGRV